MKQKGADSEKVLEIESSRRVIWLREGRANKDEPAVQRREHAAAAESRTRSKGRTNE